MGLTKDLFFMIIIVAIFILIILILTIRSIVKKGRERAKKIEELCGALAREDKLIEELEEILNYPVAEITRAEFDDLPDSASIDPATCPIGTWFVYPKSNAAPEITVLGHVVSSGDLLNSQWGWAALSLPKQGVNRYQASIT